MITKENIRNDLHKLRLIEREKYLELRGVDVDKFRNIESEVDKEYDRLILEIRKDLNESGKSIEEEHQKSLKRANDWIEKDIEAIAEQQGSSAFKPQGTFQLCRCFAWHMGTAIDQSSSVVLDPPASGAANGSVTFDTNGAHPYAEAKNSSSAQVNAWFKFAFTPVADREYCLSPIVQMNGHWLTWTWGGCDGSPAGVSSAQVKLKVRADQLSSTIKRSEHVVIDENTTVGTDRESGWYYDSTVDGGADMKVRLQGGHEAVIFVEVECLASVADRGRAWIDMQTSPHFYFKVPELRWGPYFC